MRGRATEYYLIGPFNLGCRHKLLCTIVPDSIPVGWRVESGAETNKYNDRESCTRQLLLYIACCVVLMMIKSLPIILTFNSRLDQIHEIANGIGPSVVRRSLTLTREEGQEYYVYRIRSTAENLQQRKLQLLHHNDGCALLGPV